MKITIAVLEAFKGQLVVVRPEGRQLVDPHKPARERELKSSYQRKTGKKLSKKDVSLLSSIF